MINKLILTAIVAFSSFASDSFSHQRQGDIRTYNQLIIGKWIYKTHDVGNIVTVFKEDGSGFSKVDSLELVYNFKYSITNNHLLKLSTGLDKPELHYIKLLNKSELILREYPFKKFRESIKLIDTDYKRQ